MAAAVEPPYPLPTPVYFAEMLKALRDDLHAGRKVTRELVDIVREQRDDTAKLTGTLEKVLDELVQARLEREKDRRQGERRQSARATSERRRKR